MHCFHNITNAVGIDGIMNEFTIAFGLDDTSPAQDGQVLGGNGLLEPEMDIEFRDCQPFMFIQNLDNLLTEFMIQGPQDHSGLLEVYKIHFNGSILTALSIEDHPIVTACASHTVRSVEVSKNIICIGYR